MNQQVEKNYTDIDLNAPRARKKYFDVAASANRGFYKTLKQKYPNLKKYSNAEIQDFIISFNKRIAQEVIDSKDGVRLFEGLGIIIAGACKISPHKEKQNFNHGLSKQLGKTVVHSNDETDKHIAKIKYTFFRDAHMFTNYKLWCFSPDRSLSRAVSEEFKKPGGYLKYILFSKNKYISHLFNQKQKYAISIKKDKVVDLENYNEFDL